MHAFSLLHCCTVTGILLFLFHIIASSMCFFTLPKPGDIGSIAAMTVANECRQGQRVLSIGNYF